MIANCPRHAAMVVHFAYLTGMRAGEIFNLTWDRVDLANRVIRLEASDTKTAEPRVVFLCDQAYDILKEAGISEVGRLLGQNQNGEPPVPQNAP